MSLPLFAVLGGSVGIVGLYILWVRKLSKK